MNVTENGVYVLYNKLSQRFGDCFSSATDATAARAVSSSITKEVFADLVLYRVAALDFVTGLVTPCDKVPVDVFYDTGAGAAIDRIEGSLTPQ